MRLLATIFLAFFCVFLFTPTFVMLVDKDTKISWMINEIEEEENSKTKIADKEYEYLTSFSYKQQLCSKNYLKIFKKEIFKNTRHYIDEEVPPPEFI